MRQPRASGKACKVLVRSTRLVCCAGPLALLAASVVSPAAAAGEESAPRPNPVPISTADIPTLRVTPRGGESGGGEGGLRGPDCQQVSTHTDANFEGGSFVVQAGFAQGELAAATYTVPANQFPIRLDLAEMIFATSNATQVTTTEWSVLVWDGNPQTGQLIASHSSDGKILPHIVMGAGTNGVNVQFSIDPKDPEQIIVFNNGGSNTFTVGFRIDRHNQPPQNPCVTSPPTCCNAFPVTDVSGLASPANNWLFGLNCGPFGCPANGGWSRFSQLAAFCRPTGDWVIRATWSSLDCQPGVGACCMPDGTCQPATADLCSGMGGAFQGDGTDCGGVNCPIAPQACCFESTGGCINLRPADCSAAGGIPQGLGTACATTVCFPMGACCLPDGACQGPVSPEDCAAAGGVFQGNNTSCAAIDCPDPVGACCFPNRFCLVLTQAECDNVGAAWHGPGTDCSDADMNGTADACDPPPPACPGDWNNDEALNSNDYFAFLDDFFAGDADFNGDETTNSDDYFAFLNAYFKGC